MKHLTFLLLLALLTGCGGGNVVLDNPRSVSVAFEFDGNDSHEVPADSRVEIALEPGRHALRVMADGEQVVDTSIQVSEGGIVHSGASTYVVWKQLYGLQNDRKTLLNEKWVEFDSVKTYGDFKVYPPDWVYIESTWDYGLDAELPDAQSLYINKDFMIESKVFRSKDFVDTYREKAKAAE